MRYLILVFTALFFIDCSAQKPTKENIEKAVRSTWDRNAVGSSPKQSILIHSIKIGSSAKVSLQDKIDGIPPSSAVTITEVDFTVREFYSDKTQVTHRLMTAKIFKDQFGEWAFKSNGMKITETSFEPK